MNFMMSCKADRLGRSQVGGEAWGRLTRREQAEAEQLMVNRLGDGDRIAATDAPLSAPRL